MTKPVLLIVLAVLATIAVLLPTASANCCGDSWCVWPFSKSCNNCYAGYYKNTDGCDSCSSCGTGRYHDGNSGGCHGDTSCKICPGGRYQNENQKTSCKICAGGRYVSCVRARSWSRLRVRHVGLAGSQPRHSRYRRLVARPSFRCNSLIVLDRTGWTPLNREREVAEAPPARAHATLVDTVNPMRGARRQTARLVVWESTRPEPGAHLVASTVQR